MTNIAAPKIPDGEKVDFDVSQLAPFWKTAAAKV